MQYLITFYFSLSLTLCPNLRNITSFESPVVSDDDPLLSPITLMSSRSDERVRRQDSQAISVAERVEFEP